MCFGSSRMTVDMQMNNATYCAFPPAYTHRVSGNFTMSSRVNRFTSLHLVQPHWCCHCFKMRNDNSNRTLIPTNLIYVIHEMATEIQMPQHTLHTNEKITIKIIARTVYRPTDLQWPALEYCFHLHRFRI